MTVLVPCAGIVDCRIHMNLSAIILIFGICNISIMWLYRMTRQPLTWNGQEKTVNQEPKILYVIGSAETEALGETLQRFGAVKQVGSMAEMNQALAAEMYDIVFCDASFADGTWHQALSVIQKKNWDVPAVVVKGKTSIEES